MSLEHTLRDLSWLGYSNDFNNFTQELKNCPHIDMLVIQEKINVFHISQHYTEQLLCYFSLDQAGGPTTPSPEVCSRYG